MLSTGDGTQLWIKRVIGGELHWTCTGVVLVMWMSWALGVGPQVHCSYTGYNIELDTGRCTSGTQWLGTQIGTADGLMMMWWSWNNHWGCIYFGKHMPALESGSRHEYIFRSGKWLTTSYAFFFPTWPNIKHVQGILTRFLADATKGFFLSLIKETSTHLEDLDRSTYAPITGMLHCPNI